MATTRVPPHPAGGKQPDFPGAGGNSPATAVPREAQGSVMPFLPCHAVRLNWDNLFATGGCGLRVMIQGAA